MKPLLAARDFDQLRNEIIERLGSVDLMCVHVARSNGSTSAT
jgi:hypothetical protein